MAEKQTTKLYFFLAYAWVSYCLVRRQLSRGADEDEPTPGGMVHYPLLLVASKLLFDNCRLLYGTIDAHVAAPLFMAQISYVLRMAVQPTLLATYASLIGSVLGWAWLCYFGGAVTVFFMMKGLNAYVSQVHDALEFTDKDGVARYNKDLNKITDDGPVYLLPQTVMVVGAVMVTFITMATTGDIIPFALQIVALLAKSASPVEDESGLLVANFAQLVSMTGFMRVQRYI